MLHPSIWDRQKQQVRCESTKVTTAKCRIVPCPLAARYRHHLKQWNQKSAKSEKSKVMQSWITQWANGPLKQAPHATSESISIIYFAKVSGHRCMRKIKFVEHSTKISKPESLHLPTILKAVVRQSRVILATFVPAHTRGIQSCNVQANLQIRSISNHLAPKCTNQVKVWMFQSADSWGVHGTPNLGHHLKYSLHLQKVTDSVWASAREFSCKIRPELGRWSQCSHLANICNRKWIHQKLLEITWAQNP